MDLQPEVFTNYYNYARLTINSVRKEQKGTLLSLVLKNIQLDDEREKEASMMNF